MISESGSIGLTKRTVFSLNPTLTSTKLAALVSPKKIKFSTPIFTLSKPSKSFTVIVVVSSAIPVIWYLVFLASELTIRESPIFNWRVSV